jgi:hypothetical protein
VSASGPNLDLPTPAGVVALDLLMAVVTWDSQTGVITAPGWTFLRRDLEGSENYQGIFYKFSEGTEPATHTFTSDDSGSGDSTGIITA